MENKKKNNTGKIIGFGLAGASIVWIIIVYINLKSISNEFTFGLLLGSFFFLGVIIYNSNLFKL